MSIAIVGHQMQYVDERVEEMSARLATYISLYDTPAYQVPSAQEQRTPYRDLGPSLHQGDERIPKS